MPLKPMHKRNGFDTRKAVWNAIRTKKVFSLRELRNETVMQLDSVREYVIGLEKAGYIERIPTTEQGIGEAVYWKLVRDVGVDAPRVRKDGSPVTQGKGRENLWKAMRVLKTFTVRELTIHARTPGCEVKESTAEEYARHLCYAGYLHRHKDGSYTMLLSAYTGPKAPMIQRTKVVWDPNTNQVRWRSEVDHDQ